MKRFTTLLLHEIKVMEDVEMRVAGDELYLFFRFDAKLYSIIFTGVQTRQMPNLQYADIESIPWYGRYHLCTNQDWMLFQAEPRGELEKSGQVPQAYWKIAPSTDMMNPIFELRPVNAGDVCTQVTNDGTILCIVSTSTWSQECVQVIQVPVGDADAFDPVFPAWQNVPLAPALHGAKMHGIYQGLAIHSHDMNAIVSDISGAGPVEWDDVRHAWRLQPQETAHMIHQHMVEGKLMDVIPCGDGTFYFRRSKVSYSCSDFELWVLRFVNAMNKAE
jgi:hypothetical protein